MTEQEKERINNWFADGFDTYLADGRVPPGTDGDTVLGKYVRDVIDRNPNLGGADREWQESFRDSLEDFVTGMTEKFSDVDSSGEMEKMMRKRFIEGSVDEKRAMWNEVKNLTRAVYSSGDLDTDEFDRRLDSDNNESVFAAFEQQWSEAAAKRQESVRRNILSSAAAQWEKTCQRECRQDYRVRIKVRKSLRRYPLLDMIATLIGRGDAPQSQSRRCFMSCGGNSGRYAPPASDEIDRVTVGNNLERVIPVELAYLADPDTEMLFLTRYAGRRLQQFSAPAPDRTARRQDTPVAQKTGCGPIIVCVDTSSSMDGCPREVSFALLYRLIEIGRREKRRCYLITFSVRSQAIDLSDNKMHRHLEEFLENSFTGGTSGESMLHEAIGCLQTDNYCNADVLIISDFAFAPPSPATLSAIIAEQMNGTRFFGLQIGHFSTPYSQILDRLWSIEP